TSRPAPSISPRAPAGTGAGLAILVNANAKRGGRRVPAQIGRTLPGASVRLTRTADEIGVWLQTLPAPRVVPYGGTPTVGILPLGTGNGWAHALGAPKLHRCLSLLAQTPGPLPARRCG